MLRLNFSPVVREASLEKGQRRERRREGNTALNLISHFGPFQLLQRHYRRTAEKLLSWRVSVEGGGQGALSLKAGDDKWPPLTYSSIHSSNVLAFTGFRALCHAVGLTIP